MPLDIIVGTQWGDEGKGRITDLLAAKADIVARYSGGDNAGHTVSIGDEIYKLHLLPSGIINPNVTCIIGNGLVVNPTVLLGEIQDLFVRGIDVTPQRLKLSDRAHLVTPGHIALDQSAELAKGDKAIGTTQRGIGPTYTHKTARTGLRTGLLADKDSLLDAISRHIESVNQKLLIEQRIPKLDVNEIKSQFATCSDLLTPFLADTSHFLDDALNGKANVLAEGAQGTLLDLDHGTYPFVTSSWPISAGALLGLGIGPKHVRRVIGVAKAFTSRVGSGPFPTELFADAAERLRGSGQKPWDEYGTTTGRPRRVGWLDLVILKYAVRVNGLTELALTKLDILSDIPNIPVCVAYNYHDQVIDSFPADLKVLGECEPILDYLAGWKGDIASIRKRNDLPLNAKKYVDFIQEFLGIPVRLISVGPERDQIIIC